ncbi:MAG: MerR family transcriptional regulator [Marinomonas colpomeniae]
MYIGKVSQLTGASRKAILHYEEIGLLRHVKRSGSYRVYDQNHIVVISLIKRAQSLGIKLAELMPLVVAKEAQQSFPLDLANDLITSKRDQIKAEQQALRAKDSGLKSLQAELQKVFSGT